MEFADQQVAVIPDFIANSGMARVFAYLMQPNVEISDEAIFRMFLLLFTMRCKRSAKQQLKGHIYLLMLMKSH